jgi:hypothetical protein
LPYKIDPNPTTLACFPLSSSLRHRSPPVLLTGIHSDHSTPPKFPPHTAPSPPPLAPRPDPVQPPSLPRRNRLHPEPPLTGAARARPHRRQHPSATSLANPSTGIASPTSPGARARVRSPCSPALHREWRCATTAAAPPHRQSCSTLSRRAPPLPNNSLGPVGPARPVPPRRRPRRRRERAGAERPAAVEAGQGYTCEKKPCSRDPNAKYRGPP